jgi:S1-C subfamily serine protease
MNILFNKQIFIFFLSLLLLSSTVITSFHAYGQNSKQQQIPGLFGNGGNLLNDAFRKVKDSVVQITTEYKSSSDTSNQLFDTNGANSVRGKSGSGFVYDRSGYIITNYHVVSSAINIVVTFNDGNSYSAKLVGTDPDGDVAVIKIVDPVNEKLVPVIFSNSTNLKIGDPVLAIGNPYGLDNTLTFGIISQMGRLLPDSDSGYSIPNVIQTDAAINPGNSGGPLIDLNGSVIGMNTAILSNTGAYTGVGFAIPSYDILSVLPSLIKNGTHEHPWLGIIESKLSPDLTDLFGLPRNYKGVLIDNVIKDGPAAKAGLIDKDILIGVDNITVSRIDDVISYLDLDKKVGDDLKLTVNRNGQILNLTANLTPRPAVSVLNNTFSSLSPGQQDTNPYSPLPNLPQLPQLPNFKLPQLPNFKLPQLPNFKLFG